MKRLIIAIAVLLLTAQAASAKTACLATHGTDAYYQYRIVDGRKCWYRGAERLEKSDLVWKRKPRLPAEAIRVERSDAVATVAVRVDAPSLLPQPIPFDEVFAHFPAYEVAHPPLHLLFPQRVAQAWGSKRVAVVLYRRE